LPVFCIQKAQTNIISGNSGLILLSYILDGWENIIKLLEDAVEESSYDLIFERIFERELFNVVFAWADFLCGRFDFRFGSCG